MAKIVVLNGPNLNLLGVREPEIYGAARLEDIHSGLKALAADSGHFLQFFQSNAEHELVERIHGAYNDGVDYILINPAAFTHTSIALRDAMLGTGIPFVEVHLSNVHAREPFRKHSYLSDIAQGVVCGFGAKSYEIALQAVFHKLDENVSL